VDADNRYLARSWALLTRDRGWHKPVLALCAVSLVPIVGHIGVEGYALEWARLTAWDVDSSPKQKGVDVGECLVSGLRALGVRIAWAFLVGVVSAFLLALPLVSGLFELVQPAVQFVVMGATAALALRATIYHQLGAGFSVSHVWEMAKRRPGGFMRVCGISLLFYVALVLLLVVPWSVALGVYLVQSSMLTYAEPVVSGYASSQEVRLFAAELMRFLGTSGTLISYSILVVSVTSVFRELLTNTACGLWFRNFDVPAWGASSDPLPPETPVDGGFAALPPVGGYVAQDPYQQADPYQQVYSQADSQQWVPAQDAYPPVDAYQPDPYPQQDAQWVPEQDTYPQPQEWDPFGYPVPDTPADAQFDPEPQPVQVPTYDLPSLEEIDASSTPEE